MQRIILLTLIFCANAVATQSWADIQVQGYLNQASLENLAADPTCTPASTCPSGRVYWNTTDDEPKIWDGLAWQEILVGSSAVPDPLLLGDNSAGAPTYSFTSDPDTGLFWALDGRIDFSSNGAFGAVFDGQGFSVEAGNAANPSYRWFNDLNTGLFSAGADDIGFSTGGETRLTLSDNASFGSTFRDEDGTMRLTVASGAGDSFLRLVAEDGVSTSDSVIEFGDSVDGDVGRIFYDHSADDMLFYTTGANLRLNIGSTINPNVVIRTINGTEGAPSYSFANATDMGLRYRSGTSASFSVGGTETWIFGSTTNRSLLQSQTINGSSGAPGYSFTSTPSSGLFYSTSGGDHVGIAEEGDISAKFYGGLVQLYMAGFGVGSSTVCRAGSSGSLESVGPCTSSIRYKENVLDVSEEEINKVMDLRPVSFDWKDSGRRDYGLIAEEVESVLPILVEYGKDEDGNTQVNSLNYRHFTAILLAHSQSLKKEIDVLKTRLDSLEAAQ